MQQISILDNGDLCYRASLVPVVSLMGGHALTITSQHRASRNPDEQQVRFLACLEPEGMQALADLVQQPSQTCSGSTPTT